MTATHIAVGGAVLLIVFAALYLGNWLDMRRQPARPTGGAVVPAPMAVVKAPRPADRTDRTTRQLAQAELANRELATAYRLLAEENRRLREALAAPVMDLWPTDTVEITEADLLPEVTYHHAPVDVDAWLADWLQPSHV